jgi:hypothetical protein
MSYLRKAERRELLIDCAAELSTRLRMLIQSDGWTAKELSDISGIPCNRISELKNHDKYKRPISINSLIKAISVGFVTVRQLTIYATMLGAGMNKEKSDYLKRLKAFESKKFLFLLKAIEEKGGDPLRALLNELKRLKQKA